MAVTTRRRGAKAAIKASTTHKRQQGGKQPPKPRTTKARTTKERKNPQDPAQDQQQPQQEVPQEEVPQEDEVPDVQEGPVPQEPAEQPAEQHQGADLPFKHQKPLFLQQEMPQEEVPDVQEGPAPQEPTEQPVEQPAKQYQRAGHPFKRQKPLFRIHPPPPPVYYPQYRAGHPFKPPTPLFRMDPPPPPVYYPQYGAGHPFKPPTPLFRMDPPPPPMYYPPYTQALYPGHHPGYPQYGFLPYHGVVLQPQPQPQPQVQESQSQSQSQSREVSRQISWSPSLAPESAEERQQRITLMAPNLYRGAGGVATPTPQPERVPDTPGENDQFHLASIKEPMTRASQRARTISYPEKIHLLKIVLSCREEFLNITLVSTGMFWAAISAQFESVSGRKYSAESCQRRLARMEKDWRATIALRKAEEESSKEPERSYGQYQLLMDDYCELVDMRKAEQIREMEEKAKIARRLEERSNMLKRLG